LTNAADRLAAQQMLRRGGCHRRPKHPGVPHCRPPRRPGGTGAPVCPRARAIGWCAAGVLPAACRLARQLADHLRV